MDDMLGPSQGALSDKSWYFDLSEIKEGKAKLTTPTSGVVTRVETGTTPESTPQTAKLITPEDDSNTRGTIIQSNTQNPELAVLMHPGESATQAQAETLVKSEVEDSSSVAVEHHTALPKSSIQGQGKVVDDTSKETTVLLRTADPEVQKAEIQNEKVIPDFEPVIDPKAIKLRSKEMRIETLDKGMENLSKLAIRMQLAPYIHILESELSKKNLTFTDADYEKVIANIEQQKADLNSDKFFTRLNAQDKFEIPEGKIYGKYSTNTKLEVTTKRTAIVKEAVAAVIKEKAGVSPSLLDSIKSAVRSGVEGMKRFGNAISTLANNMAQTVQSSLSQFASDLKTTSISNSIKNLFTSQKGAVGTSFIITIGEKVKARGLSAEEFQVRDQTRAESLKKNFTGALAAIEDAKTTGDFNNILKAMKGMLASEAQTGMRSHIMGYDKEKALKGETQHSSIEASRADLHTKVSEKTGALNVEMTADYTQNLKDNLDLAKNGRDLSDLEKKNVQTKVADAVNMEVYNQVKADVTHGNERFATARGLRGYCESLIITRKMEWDGSIAEINQGGKTLLNPDGTKMTEPPAMTEKNRSELKLILSSIVSLHLTDATHAGIVSTTLSDISAMINKKAESPPEVVKESVEEVFKESVEL